MTIFALIPLCPSANEAQAQLLLRYDPILDLVVHTAFQTVAVITTEDGRVIETADLGSMRAVAMESEEGGLVLHLAYDSVAARIRARGGEWRQFEVPGADSAWVQVGIDDRMRVLATHKRSRLPDVTGLLDVLTGIPDLTLPDGAIRNGGAWYVESKLPERVAVSVPPEVGALPSLTYSTRITLDSTVVRTQDTLGFFTFAGDVRASSEADMRALVAAGLKVFSEMTGQLVWSSGWNGFVSGANRVTLEISKGRYSDAPTIERNAPTLTIQVTTRFQVRS